MSKEFWLKIKEGDRSGLQLLYKEYFQILYKFALFFHNDSTEVEDAIHDVFLRVWEKRSSHNLPENTKNYLMTAVRNEIYQKYRKSNKIDLVENFKESPEEVQQIDQDDYKDDQKKKVASAMQLLTAKNREIIHLKYQENLSNEEIAEVLGINYQSVRNLLHRAIKALRKNISKSEYKT